jgi:hypothetical protein
LDAATSVKTMPVAVVASVCASVVIVALLS